MLVRDDVTYVEIQQTSEAQHIHACDRLSFSKSDFVCILCTLLSTRIELGC